jgi:glyoxylase-like metal-dependent hydrolase (beta-lactamase superfamily II)
VTLRIERYGDVTRLRMSSAGSRAVGLDVSAYVVRGVMIDVGFRRVERELVAAAKAAGVRGAIVTHWHEDHAGNVGALAAMGLPIAMREDTAGILCERPHIQLYRRVVWGWPRSLGISPAPFDAGGLETIHTPGHSTDHQVVWDAATRTLFSGDLWLGVRARILHATEDPYRIIESLRAVLALRPERMFDAHRGLVTRPVDALRAKIAWMGETVEAIEERIRRGESDRQIVRDVLGGEEMAAVLSRGDYARRNFVRAVRARLAGDLGAGGQPL